MNFSRKIFFLTSGRVNSPGNFRTVRMARSFAKLGLNAFLLIDDSDNNLFDIEKFSHQNLTIAAYKSKPRLTGVFQVRSLIKLHNPDWIVQINPSIRAFLTLIFSKNLVVGEWDEPPILRSQHFFLRSLAYLLHFWLINRSSLHISCTRAFMSHLPNPIYIPHGQYVENLHLEANVSVGDYYAYLGNFYPLWDHELIIKWVESAAHRGYRPNIVMVGSGPDLKKWQDYALRKGLSNIKFTGHLDVEDWMPLMKGAIALLFPMRDTPLNRCRCSSKIFAYLAANRPIVAHKVGEIIELTDNETCLLAPGSDLIQALEDGAFAQCKVKTTGKVRTYDQLARGYALVLGYKFD
jgi:glycosyltransferase involved in cell wall biosynthesis